MLAKIMTKVHNFTVIDLSIFKIYLVTIWLLLAKLFPSIIEWSIWIYGIIALATWWWVVYRLFAK